MFEYVYYKIAQKHAFYRTSHIFTISIFSNDRKVVLQVGILYPDHLLFVCCDSKTNIHTLHASFVRTSLLEFRECSICVYFSASPFSGRRTDVQLRGSNHLAGSGFGDLPSSAELVLRHLILMCGV